MIFRRMTTKTTEAKQSHGPMAHTVYFHRSNPIMTRKRNRSLSDNTLLLQTADGAAHSGGSGGCCLPSTSSNGLGRSE
jgi:hypothetical protein